MTHVFHSLAAASAEREAIPVAIPVGILVDFGSTRARPRRPERRGRLAPPHSMLLPAFEPTPPPPAPPADAWWLSAEEWVAPKPADRGPAASEEEPPVSRWIVGMVWSVFAGLMV